MLCSTAISVNIEKQLWNKIRARQELEDHLPQETTQAAGRVSSKKIPVQRNLRINHNNKKEKP